MNTAIRNAMPEGRPEELAGDPVRAPWTTVEMMLATLIDEVRINSWLYAQAHTDQTLPKPSPIPRPGVRARRRRRLSLDAAIAIDPRLRGMSPEEAQAFLDGVMMHRG